MEKKSFVLKGNIVYSGENKELCSIEGGYVVCENGICRGAFEKLPKQYETLPLTDYGRSEERRVGKECRSRWSPYH